MTGAEAALYPPGVALQRNCAGSNVFFSQRFETFLVLTLSLAFGCWPTFDKRFYLYLVCWDFSDV